MLLFFKCLNLQPKERLVGIIISRKYNFAIHFFAQFPLILLQSSHKTAKFHKSVDPIIFNISKQLEVFPALSEESFHEDAEETGDTASYILKVGTIAVSS